MFAQELCNGLLENKTVVVKEVGEKKKKDNQ